MLNQLIKAILLASIVAFSACADLVPIPREIVVDSGDTTKVKWELKEIKRELPILVDGSYYNGKMWIASK